MSDRYVEIDSERFGTFLANQGFSPDVVNNELVFSKKYQDTDLVVKVYSSIKEGSSVARDVGTDAIRVVVILDNGKKTYGIGRFPRVYRTGSQEKVEERTLNRINLAFARCEEWQEEQAAKRSPEKQQLPLQSSGACKAPNGCINHDACNAANKCIGTPTSYPFNSHVGFIGEQLELTLKVIRKHPWNNKFVFTMQDDTGNIFTFWTEKDILKVDSKYNVHCTVKKHNIFNGTKQTEITDCYGRLT